jgi:hypothetical protein
MELAQHLTCCGGLYCDFLLSEVKSSTRCISLCIQIVVVEICKEQGETNAAQGIWEWARGGAGGGGG